MASSTGGSEMSSGAPAGSMANGWAGAAILGFLAFGLTAILFGLSQLPKPYGNGFAQFATVNGVSDAVVGGVILVLVGLIGLIRGHAYWGSAFLGFGGFWYVWATTGQGLQSLINFAVPSAAPYAVAGLAFVWMLFTLTYLLSSMKHGWFTFIAFLLLFVSFILLIVVAWQTGAATKPPGVGSGEQWALGGLWIFTGLLWWLHGTADLTNHSYGRKVIPL
jgi:succinate-acetate transporter protein